MILRNKRERTKRNASKRFLLCLICQSFTISVVAQEVSLPAPVASIKPLSMAEVSSRFIDAPNDVKRIINDADQVFKIGLHSYIVVGSPRENDYRFFPKNHSAGIYDQAIQCSFLS